MVGGVRIADRISVTYLQAVRECPQRRFAGIHIYAHITVHITVHINVYLNDYLNDHMNLYLNDHTANIHYEEQS